MSIFDKIGRAFGLTSTEHWMAYFGRPTTSGKNVTPETALQLATVWACIRLTATAVSSMPLRLYQKGAKGGRTPIDHPLNAIIGENPNADLTAMEFWEAMTAWLMMNGNAYAEIVREGNRVVALNLLPADRVQVSRDPNTYELRYAFTDQGRRIVLPAEQVLHLRAFSFGGDLGLSPIVYGAQTFGSAIAADETAASTFASGLNPSGFFKFNQTLDDEQRKQAKKNLIDPLKGSSNVGNVGILEAGVEFTPITIDPETAQMLETRRFNVEEICRFFGVPPVMVSHAAQGQTMWGTGVEAIILQWMVMGLNPLLTRIEERIKMQLLTPAERRTIYPRFNRESILQMDSTTKAAVSSTLVQNGIYTRAKVREMWDEPFIAGTDGLTVQSNLVPLDQLGKTTDPRADMRRAIGLEDDE
jgi:HK97 family phage portal protein